MSTDIAVREQTVLTNDQLSYLARTEFVQRELRGNMPAILACVATGRALGIDDMTALRSIYVIEGKATFSAELMVMLVRRRGHSITGEVTEGKATAIGTRADTGDSMTSTWTLAMAERAGLLNKQNWRKYPESMLWARAVSQLCRMLFADCFAGATYTTEELGEEHTDSAGEPMAVTADPGVDSATVSQASESQAEPASPAEDRLFPPVDENGEVIGAGAEPETEVPLLTGAQQRLILAKAAQAGIDDDERHALTEAITGQPSSTRIPKALVNAVLAEIERRAVSGGGEFRIPESAQ